ncbi:hypothetical protein V501_03893 [Pseudogymnoascus sp. VKM F-4519 (FW-2642)]|nr:hypothetical protein V501_03893 [Pseudogymnoascus sp. VKM F-4519 (FW-2642)]
MQGNRTLPTNVTLVWRTSFRSFTTNGIYATVKEHRLGWKCGVSDDFNGSKVRGVDVGYDWFLDRQGKETSHLRPSPPTRNDSSASMASSPPNSATLMEHKYFDSGDYALSKAGKASSVDAESVGSRHPLLENIPHLSSPGVGIASQGGGGNSNINPGAASGSLPRIMSRPRAENMGPNYHIQNTI